MSPIEAEIIRRKLSIIVENLRALEPIGKIPQEALIIISARLGKLRIVDNIIFRRNPG